MDENPVLVEVRPGYRLDNDLSVQLDLERDLQREASLNPDYGEGVRAFMEKRAAVFMGRRSH